MLDIFTISPYITGLGVAIFHTFILLAKIWKPKEESNQISLRKSQFNFVQEFLGLLFFLFGVIFLNSSIFWLSSQWTYVDWPFQLPNVILGIFAGIQYIIKSLFLKPKKIDLIFAVIFFGFIFCSINLFIIGPSNLEEDLVVVLIVNVSIIIVFILIRKDLETKRKLGNNLWDISDKFYKIFNTKVVLITWIIASINVMLNFNSASIFGW